MSDHLSDDELARLLDEHRESVNAEADAAFPADRLARQQSRILARIEHEGRPGRLIAFPAGYAHAPAALRARPGMRWVAGAAAAGLLIGVVAGQLTYDFSTRDRTRVAQVVASRPDAGAPALRAVSTTLSEEEFLGQLEMAIEGIRPDSLQPLDEMTPRVWEIAAR
ncbi:MAG: hypothetical protein FJW14_15820 [Acidimicrobiia bacterium]|nr:hypothetical protein [Acidimicrobiia bacterium]